MSKQSFRYLLGSYRRWRETLVLLVVASLIGSVLLSIFFRYIGITFGLTIYAALIFFVTALGVFALNGLNLPGTDDNVPWLSDITVNLAHGWAAEDGIHFRKWFRHRFVSWKGIARVEYWPDRQGRIDLYLYSQRSPVVFMAAPPRHAPAEAAAAGEPEAVSYISLKLKEAWPGCSPFLISFENAHSKAGLITMWLAKLSIWQRAFANVLLMLLIVILCYAYVAIRIATRAYFWKAMAVIYGFLLITLFSLRLLRRSKANNTAKKLTSTNS